MLNWIELGLIGLNLIEWGCIGINLHGFGVSLGELAVNWDDLIGLNWIELG